MILETIFTLLAVFKPVHPMQTEEVSCGDSYKRLMKEKVKVDYFQVNGMDWELQGVNDKGDLILRYQVREDQYMKLELVLNTRDAYLTLSGIDAKRRPCKDQIYLRRVKR